MPAAHIAYPLSFFLDDSPTLSYDWYRPLLEDTTNALTRHDFRLLNNASSMLY